MKKTLLILCLLLSYWGRGKAQTLPFRTYSIEKGLSESVVNDLIQDQEGYLWVGTSYGLNRFDGIQFKNYYAKDGLLDNKILSLYEDHNNQLWVGTSNGINVIKADSMQTVPELKSLNSSAVLSIIQDHFNEYWFATDGEGVWHLDKNGVLTQYREVNGLGDDKVRDVVEDARGVLWFATYDGLTKLEDGNFRTFTTKHGLADNRLRDLAVGRDSTLWVASRSGLCRVKDELFTCYDEQDGLVNNRVQSISIDPKRGLWVGTEEGVSFFDGDGFTNYSVDEGLANNFIHSTLYDREGNIWFGTLGGGFTLFMGNYFKSYTVEGGLPTNVVSDISQDAAGNHWVTTYGGGVVQISPDGIKTFNTTDGLADNKTYTLHPREEGGMYIGTRSGLSVYEEGKVKTVDSTQLSGYKIRSLHSSQQSNTLWLGTDGKGVLKYDRGGIEQITEEDGLANNTVRSIAETPDGSIWLATYGGISRFKNGRYTNYTIRDGLPNNGVMDILKDKSGTLWFATFGGIARFSNGTFETITTKEGLPDEVCYFIEQDNSGIYWIGTTKGIVRFDYKSFIAKEDSQSTRPFKLITQSQGLVSNEMNAGASFKDRDGNLWFGSVGGLTQFDPSQVMENNAAPKVHIEGVSISGDQVPLTSNLEIASNDHNVIFSFIGINFLAPDQVKYKYRLRNSGEGWQTTKERKVRYSTLPPGDYTFEVEAQNNDGQWSTHKATVSFTVLAPFWMQWWFIVLALLALAGIIAFIYNYYRVRKMVDIERMRVRIASDLHDDVGSALTEIALQSDFLQTMDVADSVEEPLKQIGEQSRKIVSSLDDIVWSIDARNDTIGDLTDRMQDYVSSVLSEKQVNYDFNGNMQQKMEVVLKENLYLIFKEAINNIAKHSNADRVEVELAMNGSNFEMSVKDNGTGIENARKTGQGLRNMKMRAKRIDANITFISNNGFEVRVADAD